MRPYTFTKPRLVHKSKRGGLRLSLFSHLNQMKSTVVKYRKSLKDSPNRVEEIRLQAKIETLEESISNLHSLLQLDIQKNSQKEKS